MSLRLSEMMRPRNYSSNENPHSRILELLRQTGIFPLHCIIAFALDGRCKLRCSGRIRRSCSTSGTRYVTQGLIVFL